MFCPKGEIRKNLDVTKKYIQESENVDFICFPEMNITGYINETDYPDSLLSLNSPEVEEFVKMTEKSDITAIAGIAEKNPDGKPFITQIISYKGELFGYYRKTNISEDEKGLYTGGSEISVFNHPKINFGVSICADIEKKEIFKKYADQKSDIVFESAAPGLYGSQETRNWQRGYNWWKKECQTKLAGYARDYKIHIAVSTQAGRTVNEDFPGGGYVFDPEGKMIFSTSDWKKGVLYADLKL